MDGRPQVLYAHGNLFADIKSISGVANCPSLRKLSLHGAPIESIRSYRVKVLTIVRCLRRHTVNCRPRPCFVPPTCSKDH